MLTREILQHEYHTNDLSLRQIAQKYNKSVATIYRTMKKLGVTIKDKSEAQTLALKSGRHKHPTLGTKRSEATKRSISNKLGDYWDNISDSDLASRTQKAQENWNNMTEEQKINLRKKSAKAIRQAADTGSKIEKFLLTQLTSNGYNVEFHAERLVRQDKLQVDLLITNPLIAIEINGPSHYKPIWGKKNLLKTQQRDSKKMGMLMELGFYVLKVKYLCKNLSQRKQNLILKNVLESIKLFGKNGTDNMIEITVE